MQAYHHVISDDLTVLLKQLVANDSFRVAGTVLYVYFRRIWKIDDELAAYYVVRYFQKYFSQQLSRHHQKHATVH